MRILHANLNLVILVHSIDADNNGNQHAQTSNDHDREHFHDGLLEGKSVAAKTPLPVRMKPRKRFGVLSVYHFPGERHKRKKTNLLTTKIV